MIWLSATVLAGLFQAWRTAVQQRVRAELSVNAAGLVRYVFGFPVGCLILAAYLLATQVSVPPHQADFWVFAALGGIAQILGTNLLILAFGFRNYVVGSAYAKTEAFQGAILALILLGEQLSGLTWTGIAVGVVGVAILSFGGQRPRLGDLVQPAALCGLGAGLLFALTSVFIKRATLSIATADKILAALLTLVVVLAMQSLLQGAYVALREREQLGRIARSWQFSGQVGLLAAMGSACWFIGFAHAPVALVRAVGQVEVFFTLGFGRYYLREPLARSELIGLLTVGAGVALALVGSF